MSSTLIPAQPYTQPSSDPSGYRVNAFTLTRRGQGNGASVIEVDGQVVIGNRQMLKHMVLDELERGSRRFVIDFARAGYIDTTGLGVLVSASKKIREHGGTLTLSALNDDLRTLFELTKMDVLFSIADTIDIALEHLAAQR